MPNVNGIETEFYLKYYSKLSDIIWLSEITGEEVTGVEIVKPEDAGGHHAAVYSLTCTITSSPSPLKLIVKLLGEGRPEQGFEREIEVYKRFLQPLQDRGLINSPKFYFGDCDSSTGAKVIILEQLDAVHCGRFFGYTSPHNRGKDLAEMTKDYPGVTDVMITEKAFVQVAHLHGAYWCMPKSEIPPCVQGGDWILSPDQEVNKSPDGNLSVGEQQYNAMIKFARDEWPKRHEKRPNVKLNKYLEDLVTHSLDSSNFESFTKLLNSRPYTIIHSDFYPANSMIELVKDGDDKKETIDVKIYLIDYEVISVGPGPQDLAQWMISHVEPNTRQENEMKLLETYYEALQKVWFELHGAEKAQQFLSAYPFAMLKEDYMNGVGKWIWLLAICVSFCEVISDELYQHFIDQMTHFLQSWEISIERGNVPTPRS